jgi:hypothetical protein
LIREKRIPFPRLQRVGKLKIRLWTPKDVRRARQENRKARKQTGLPTVCAADKP